MSIELESLAEIKTNIQKSTINEIIKRDIIIKIQELETNLITLDILEKEYLTSHIIFDQYITRKKMLIEEQIKLKDDIQNTIIDKYEDKITDKNNTILKKLKNEIDKNINWITILLNVSQILVSLKF